MFRCILACDLKGGIVVRGVRGEREKYRPIQEYSRIVNTSEPLEVIRAMKPKETYIADLDRITGVGDHLQTIAGISALTRTMVDAGISREADAAQLRKVSGGIILGTETASLSLIEALQGKDVIVSIDLRHGNMMSADPALCGSPINTVRALNELDLGSIILLDVARVGSGEGIDLGLLRNAISASKHPVIMGGGVRDMRDLEQIEQAGAAGAIIASAVHSLTIPLDLLR